MIEKIKRLMSFHNMTQKQLADALGLQQAYLCKIFKGRLKPSIDFALSISKYFKVSLDWLLNEEN